MKASEFIDKIGKYSATLKVKSGKTGTITVKTVVFADDISQAKALLSAAYGEDSIVNVNRLS
jgi:hypothetical protein